jgi:peptide methionine sulfoxide reductase msrA/msrB
MKKIINLCFLITLFSTSCAQSNLKSKSDTNGAKNGYKLNISDQDWKKRLTPDQYYILREKGTEKPFSGKFVFTKERGLYKCGGCGESLFTDDMKFESHCGWPSFDKEIAGGKIIQTEDTSFGMRRTEITCAKCGSHLGHIFDDGPTETGKRYCVNSSSLTFEPQKTSSKKNTPETITLAGVCFWCIEAVFESLKGVEKVESGYANGNTDNPTYKQVCSCSTGYAEAVQITFDTSVISLEEFLGVFFTLHDPTTLNRQGEDIGTQYRSGIYFQNDEQRKSTLKVIDKLKKNKIFDSPIIIEVSQFKNFYKAENYHQEYYELNKTQPYCKLVIKPKIDKLNKLFTHQLKSK